MKEEQHKRCRSLTHNSKNRIFTDLNESHGEEKKHLKASFIDDNNNISKNHMQNLEKSIQINKELISDLLKDSKMGIIEKEVSIKLNLENALLQKQLSEMKEKYSEVQAKLLISEQISQELRLKEEEVKTEFMEKNKEFLHQLSRKEYILQLYERRYTRAEELLKNYARKEQSVWKELKKLNMEIESEPTYIENVVEKNDALNKKLLDCYQRINKLEEIVRNLTTENTRQKEYIEKLKLQKKSSLYNYSNIELSKIQKSSAISNNSSYVKKLEDIIKDKENEITLLESQNEYLRKKCKGLEIDMERLFIVNENLSKTLKEAGKKFDKIKNRSLSGIGTVKLNDFLGKKFENISNKKYSEATFNKLKALATMKHENIKEIIFANSLKLEKININENAKTSDDFNRKEINAGFADISEILKQKNQIKK